MCVVYLRVKQIKIGDLITGKVIKIKDYGLFIDIGEGVVLLHISDISQDTVNSIDLNSIFKVDDEIKAIVIWMNIEKRRVAVSTKELEQESGDMLKTPQLVYRNAEKMAAKYRSKRENLL
ncbi:MAG: S1 RNA-binding domain-containing protein [Pleurocapsa minor HA4230-MV1]|nr:S1 RNA-binding domain-containing protein [Pleurocapsa minor HA4230-MV1]